MVKNRVDEFFRILDEKKTDSTEAFSNLLGDSPLRNKETKGIVDALTEKTNQLRGVSQTWVPERIDRKMVGKNVVIMRYLYKGDTIPVVWYFTFYQPPTKVISETPSAWYCIGVRFDTNLEVFFQNN